MAPIAAVTDSVFPSLEPERRVLEPMGFEVRVGKCVSEEEVLALAADADGILNCYAKMTARVIAGLKRCKVIARYGIGVDNVDLAAATRAGIVVTNVPDYCVDEVSDHALALFLSVARRIVAADTAVKGGAWDVLAHRGIQRLRGQTFGLLGFGKIARALALKVQALGMRVIALDPYIDAAGMAKLQVQKVELDELLRESDVLSVHVPLSPETRGCVGERELARMKPTAILVNTSRGGLVDDEALAVALKAGKLAGAGLDVVSPEPPPPDHPLRQAPNVVLTPHLAFYSRESVLELQTKVAEEVARVVRGERPRSPVNPEVLKA